MDWIIYYLKEHGFKEKMILDDDPELTLIAEDIKYVYMKDGIQFVRFHRGSYPIELRVRIAHEGKVHEMDLSKTDGDAKSIINQAFKFREKIVKQ